MQYRIEAGVTTFAYCAATISLLADVLARELWDAGIWGAPRFAVYAAIIAGFLGMSLAAADGAHIRPQFLDFVVPKRLDRLANKFADFLSSLIYTSLGVLSVQFVVVSYENGDIAPVLDWLLWPIQLVLPYTFFSVALRYLLQAIWPRLKVATGMQEFEG